ncbi:unnamed protein product [Vicia faba]|uniref:Uncharacterized protein n=1 Tax=Vicia faba TaxID=3906 RepID=A0AAV1AEV6_VICFA|nr:unnamed protein product [Vicia faba]
MSVRLALKSLTRYCHISAEDSKWLTLPPVNITSVNTSSNKLSSSTSTTALKWVIHQFTTSLILPMCTTIVHLVSPSIRPSPLIGPPMSSSVSDEVATSITAYDIFLQPLIGHHQFGRPQSGTLFFIC